MEKRSLVNRKIQISPCFMFKAELTNKNDFNMKVLIKWSY